MERIATHESVGPGLLDTDTFAAAVRPYWIDMARVARAMAPAGQWEDVVQEALTVAWRKRTGFDGSRGTLRTWLVMIVADQARKGVRRLRGHSELVDVAAPPHRADEDLDLARALTRLTARQRTTVALFYFADLPVADVAAALRCSTGTVKSTLADARHRLRRDLGEDYRHA
jgi:RNA polymerase sigma-70 factor (ECF subfamily)